MKHLLTLLFLLCPISYLQAQFQVEIGGGGGRINGIKTVLPNIRQQNERNKSNKIGLSYKLTKNQFSAQSGLVYHSLNQSFFSDSLRNYENIDATFVGIPLQLQYNEKEREDKSAFIFTRLTAYKTLNHKAALKANYLSVAVGGGVAINMEGVVLIPSLTIEHSLSPITKSTFKSSDFIDYRPTTYDIYETDSKSRATHLLLSLALQF